MTSEIGDEDRLTVLEIYKLAVEMADRVSARRATANSFYLALHSALAGFLLFSVSGRGLGAALSESLLVLTTAAGLVLAVLWRISLANYQQLNKAKFEAINQLEERLPVKLFTAEWGILERGRKDGWKRLYRELGWPERQVPVVFMTTYLVTGVCVVSTWISG